MSKKSFKILSVVFGVALIGTISFSSAYASTMDQDSSVRSGGLAITNDMVTPFGGGQVGGGTWAYDTRVSKKVKTAWSDYWHPTVTHDSSAQIGAKTPGRSCVLKNMTSHAVQSGDSDQTAYVYWNTSCGD